jgi:predicted DNA-binding transcriptional regulator YafY
MDRLVGLILYLQSRRVATASEMAAHFGRSIRTIYRDLSALGEIGVPLLAEAGVGYSLLRGYHLPPVNFTEEEAYALATNGIIARHCSDASVNRHIESALSKVRAVLHPANRDRSQRLEQNLTAAAIPSPPPAIDLTSLQKALTRCRVVRFAYQGHGQDTSEVRAVEPLGLVHYLKRWHLIAWCRLRGDYRDFRIDRMRDLTVLAESFPPRPEFSLSGFLATAMPAPGLLAEVFFTVGCVDRARRDWWPGIASEAAADGGAVLTLRALDWAHLASWLLSFGRGATVVSPPSLVPLLVDLARDAAGHHSRALSGEGSPVRG